MAAVVGMLGGCDLAGVPQAPTSTPSAPAPSEPSAAARLVCAPSERTCRSDSVARLCDAEGKSFRVEPCAAEEFCRAGTCLPFANTCREGELFTLSSTHVMFDQPDTLKPTTTSLLMLNCGDQPLELEVAQIQSARSASQQPIFSFERASPQGLVLAPGSPLKIGVTFRPEYEQWVERAALTLRARVGDAVVQKEIPVSTRAWCLSTSAKVDMGVFDTTQGALAMAQVHNCGTMPVTIVGTTTTPTPTIKTPERLRAQTFDSPKVIAPGATRTFEVEVERAVPGALNAHLELVVPPQDSIYLQDPTARSIPVVGYAYNGALPCVDRPVFLPTLKAPSALSSEGTIPPMVGHRWTTSQADDQWDTVLSLGSQPKGAPSLTRQLHDDAEFWMMPYWVGRYEFDVMAVQNQTGARTCDRESFVVEVAPEDDLYAQLSWTGVSTFNGSADLDLHVRMTTPATAGSARWGVRQHDCFASQTWKTSCFGDQGVLSNTRFDEHAPEIFRFNPIEGNDAPIRFDFGVLMRHMGSSDGVRPTLKIWRGGQLVQELDHLTQELMLPSSFWLAASYYMDMSLGAMLDLVFDLGMPK